MFKRNNRPNYYIQNNATREQRCLGTSDKEEAQRLLDAANQERQTPALNMQLGKAYITHADPKMASWNPRLPRHSTLTSSSFRPSSRMADFVSSSFCFDNVFLHHFQCSNYFLCRHHSSNGRHLPCCWLPHLSRRADHAALRLLEHAAVLN